MHLGLSTEAAPDADLATIVRGCARRGLRAIELVEGHAHGLSAASSLSAVREARRVLDGEGITQRVFRPATVAGALSEAAAELGGRLDAAVLAPAIVAGSLAAAARHYATAGSTLLLQHGTDPAEADACRRHAMSCGTSTVALSWDADPAGAPLTAAAAAVLAAAGPLLRHVRLRGSGPEAAGSEGRGIGALLCRLALQRYDGVLILAPSAPETLPVWRLWLGRGAGWGCGSKTGDPTLVHIG
jgi:hypothetical protein